jgi:trans-aconitate methyltransferase
MVYTKVVRANASEPRCAYIPVVSFDVPAESYARFMGRYSQPLAAELLAAVDPQPGGRALDVGCGPGVVTALLADRLGARDVCAIDPSEPFVAAARARLPGVDVRLGSAERLPWPDSTFDLVLAQLVVHFMTDPVAGLREMGRVARPGGTVAASVWDYAGDRSPLSPFWLAVREIDPAHPGESSLAGARAGQLPSLFTEAGLTDVASGELTVRVPVGSFDEWWEPFTFGVGPAGQYVSALDEPARAELRERCAKRLPDGPFELSATAWLATGRV